MMIRISTAMLLLGLCPSCGNSGADSDSDAGTDARPGAADSGIDDAGQPPLPKSANWADRSTAAGVTMSTNFETAAEVFDFAVDDASYYAWEETIRRSGSGALKIIISDQDGTSGWDWWRFLDDSMEPFGSPESGLRDEYWVSYSVYIPSEYYNWVFDCPGSKKFSITSSHPSKSVNPITRDTLQFPISDDRRTGSSVANEVVIDDSGQTMWPTLYRQAAGLSAEKMNDFAGSGCDSSDFAWTNSVDLGPQSDTAPAFVGDERSQSCLDWSAQYGPTYRYGATNGGPVRGMARDASGQTPHPDPIAASPHFQPGWNTVMYHIRFPNTWAGTAGGILELFLHHPEDEAWTQIFERRDDFVMNDPSAIENGISINGGVDGYFHWGIWLTPFRTGGQPEPGVRPNTFLVYDEVIVSTAPIAAPAQ